MGYNIAMVFNLSKKEKLPEYFDGFEVIDGDVSDLRSIDKKKVVVALRWKVIANKAHNEIIKGSDFVVQPNDKRIGVQPKVLEFETI